MPTAFLILLLTLFSLASLTSNNTKLISRAFRLRSETFRKENFSISSSRMSANDSSTNSSSFFQPNEECVALIMNMGFSRNAAIHALFYTGNQSAELAVGWILENSDKNLDIPLDVHLQASSDSSDEDDSFLAGDVFKAYKMVFVVNGELNMGTGKIAAQVAHAALGLFRNMMEEDSKAEAMMAWSHTGEMKVVLRGDSTLHLETLAEQGTTLKLDHYLVQDAGHTQVAPGSTTVLGVFGKVEDVDRVTGKLKLL